MAEDATYTEHRGEFAGLRKRPDGALRSGNFQYPSFPFRTPQELLEKRVGHQQIVIVGGGLAGLTAAVDFGVRGIACVLLDDNNTVSLGSRSIAQGKRTMEIATRLGIAERMLPKGISWSKGNTLIQDKLLYSFDLSPEGEEKYQAFLCLPQYYVESMLVERAGEFPHVDLRWSSRVVDIAQGGDRVRLDVDTPEGRYALTADWVIACDGVRSAVRGLLGVPFEGDKYVENFVICDVKMVFNFPPQRMFWFDPTFDKSNISLMHQQPDSIWRVDWQLGPKDDPAEESKPEKVNTRLETMFGPDVPFETQFASIYSFEVRRVPNFRVGRVLFAGDAAHQLSPFGGGRGGNSAIQDVDNLAWKLAHVVQGKANERLIDSYHDERAPVADENMQLSRRAAEFLNPSSAHSLAVRNAVLALAPRYPFAKVLINTGRLSVAPNLRGSWLLTPDRDAWDTPLTPGTAAIDAPAGENGWLIEYLTGAFALMVYAQDRDQLDAKTIITLERLASDPTPVESLIVLGRVGHDADAIPKLYDRAGLIRKRYDLSPGAAYLFRPDQHVCARWRVWTADTVRAAVQRALGL
ncbi:MAG: FAD-dependent monooxygenase [Xanthobacteraceae bacterium]|nr:FAD-dependent monooxygenase [Xanthobacteraceae bacterium]